MLVIINDLPKEIEESAMIEGASVRQRFLYIIVPITSPIIFVIEAATSLGERRSKSLAFAKFEAVISELREPISLAISPIR